MSGYERVMRTAAAAVLLLAGLAAADGAHATNFEICVQSDADLASALDQARSVSVTAKIVQHKLTAQNQAYDLLNTVWHNGTPGVQPGSEFLGGYTADCASRAIAAGNTRIVDSGAGVYDLIEPRGSITIEGLTFDVPFGLNLGLGGGYYHTVPSGSTILFRRDAFINGNGNANSLYIDWAQAANSDSTVRIVDTLIANNSGFFFCPLELTVESGAPEFDVINSTVADNSSSDAAGSNLGGACFFASGTNAKFYAYNNIFSGTTGTGVVDLDVNTDQVVQVDNMIGSRSGPAAIFSSGNSSSDPNLDANYIPQAPSDAINSGSNSVPGGLPAADLDGGPRIVGGIVDRGAYETSIDPHPKQTVTKHGVDDGSAGTLSNAVASVVNNGGGTIDFDISDGGSCPWVITETGELDVNATATIDGYSQTGTSVNDIDPGDDAVYCIILEAGGASPPGRGLVVQNTVADSVAVTIQGLAFSNFSTTAIDLQGGSQHSILGNRFGGSVGGHALSANGFGIRLGATTHDNSIGSTDIADRNIIGDATGSGVVVASGSTGNQITGNYIGVGWAVGTSSYTNRGNGARGIYLAGDNNTISYNLIGYNAQSGIVVDSGGAHDNLISHNLIGVDASGQTLLANIDKGIHLIGDSGGTGDAPNDNTMRFNTIANNGSQGVLIDVGQGNRVRKNSIYDNVQLGIDLGVVGVAYPQTDDGGFHVLDEANRSQNFPVLTNASGGYQSGYVSGSLTTTAGDDTIDFYLAGGCDASGFGEGKVWLGAGTVTVPTPAIGFQGTVNFTLPISSASNALFDGSAITATATDSNGNTSEFSSCQSYTNDDIFAGNFEQPPT